MKAVYPESTDEYYDRIHGTGIYLEDKLRKQIAKLTADAADNAEALAIGRAVMRLEEWRKTHEYHLSWWSLLSPSGAHTEWTATLSCCPSAKAPTLPEAVALALEGDKK